MALTGKSRTWIGGGLVGAVVLAAAGWFLLIGPQFDAKADADQQLADAQTQNIVLRNRLNTLRDKAAHTDDLQAELAQLEDAVPGDHGIESLTRQLIEFANAAGVTITSISPSSPTVVTLPDTAPPAAEKSDDAEPDSDADSDAKDSPPAATSKASGAAGQLFSISITVVTTGGMEGQRAFLAAIESDGTRRALVTGTTFSPILDSAASSGAEGVSEEGGDAPEAADAGDGTAAADGTGGDAGDGTAAADTSEPLPPPPPSATEGQWTLTTQLMVFVAPQSVDDESELIDQLGENG